VVRLAEGQGAFQGRCLCSRHGPGLCAGVGGVWLCGNAEGQDWALWTDEKVGRWQEAPVRRAGR
jgi:hypothetical protein